MPMKNPPHPGDLIKTEIIDQTDGEEAGIKSITIEMRGAYAFGYLRSERGVHRLVRISPFDANKRRHTSFALVEIYPDIKETIDIEIPEKDITVDTFRSSGAGGQNVQKNETAIRITHHPTGLVVTCQNQRSRMQNLETAMNVLRARLLAMEMQKQEEEIAKLKGEHVEMGWGNQIRSYVLHPYQMVKDHRTEHETGNTGAVLDGHVGRGCTGARRHRLPPASRGIQPRGAPPATSKAPPGAVMLVLCGAREGGTQSLREPENARVWA